MADGLLLLDEPEVTRRERPGLVRVERRGPVLRPSAGAEGVFGVDLTAGCSHGCTFCHIRGSQRDPGPGRVLFDPDVSDRLRFALDDLPATPRLVVLSPSSDPLPPFVPVRAAAAEVVDLLAERRIPTLLMTRGRIDGPWVDRFAEHREFVRVAVGLATRDPVLSRALEPGAALPRTRLRAIGRLLASGVTVEVRLEPLIPDLTDTRAALRPVFEGLAEAGATRVVANYLFRRATLSGPLREALAARGMAERLDDLFAGGPVTNLGSIGPVKHLPRDLRQAGLARLAAWGAEFGLTVETTAGQNPDFPRALVAGPAPSESASRARRGRRSLRDPAPE